MHLARHHKHDSTMDYKVPLAMTLEPTFDVVLCASLLVTVAAFLICCVDMGEPFNITYLQCTGQPLPSAPGASAVRRPRNYELLWIPHGKASCCVATTTYKVAAGDIILLHPRQRAKWRFSSAHPPTIYVLEFAASPIPESWPPVRQWPVVRHLPPDNVVRPLFEYIVANSARHDKNALSLTEAVVQTLFSTFVAGPLGRLSAPPIAWPTAIHRVLQWLREFTTNTPGQGVSVDDIARVGGVCPTHLCHLFREHLGISPLEFVYQLRVTKSLIGLQEGQSVEAMAEELGFTNASHYTRRFKAFFKMTPTQMRRAMSKGYKPKLPDLPLMS